MQKMWIGGKFTDSLSKNGTIKVINPATEEVLDEVPKGTKEDAQRAVDEANKAFPEWKQIPGVQKAEMFHEIARHLRNKKEEIARILTLEGGKPLKENIDEIGWVTGCIDYYAEIGRNYRGRVLPSIESAQLSMVLKEPFGVAVCIVPWNYPLLLMAWKVAPALAAGNTVIIKPSSVTPLSTLAMAEIFSILPPGTVNIVTGSGKEVGDHLVSSDKTHVVAFTGSVEVGKHIAALAAEKVKKVILELGGKDPFIVCEDADIEVAAKGVAWAAFLNSGQVCTSTERIYVHESISKKFTEALAEFTKSLRLGPGIEPATDVGPMAGNSYRAKVEKQVDEAIGSGAKILTGGKRPPQFKKGYFYEPTVITNVNHSMRIMQEETFGPVAPVMTYKNFDEAIELANDTQYGLGANIYTYDPMNIKKFYEEVKAILS
ncbi:MAG: aldehyde dehydrogenase family protein, partial [Firmicutes bacterium]|nr:aldehyde dehydrogenase family protein [Bacillota bacterium]